MMAVPKPDKLHYFETTIAEVVDTEHPNLFHFRFRVSQEDGTSADYVFGVQRSEIEDFASNLDRVLRAAPPPVRPPRTESF